MRRRDPAPVKPVLPQHLAVFDERDWPSAPAGWPAAPHTYGRMVWDRARRKWRREVGP